MKRTTLKKNNGFTLVELAIVMVIIGILITAILSQLAPFKERMLLETNKKRLDNINKALLTYLHTEGEYPRPANLALARDDVNSLQIADVSDLIRVEGSDGKAVLFGAVPTASLNIPMENQYDAWGRKFTYAISEGLTVDGADAQDKNLFAIRVTTDGITALTNRAPLALISHGSDGNGAYGPNGVQNPCDLTKMDGNNCDFNSSVSDDLKLSFLERDVSLAENPAYYNDKIAFSLTDADVDSDYFWKQSPSDVNDIYYKDLSGRVGIGTLNPQFKLHVEGNIAIGGSVKIGPDNVDCTADKAGTVRFNPTTRRMNYCDGITTTWKELTPKVVIWSPDQKYSMSSFEKIPGTDENTFCAYTSMDVDYPYPLMDMQQCHLLYNGTDGWSYRNAVHPSFMACNFQCIRYEY